MQRVLGISQQKTIYLPLSQFIQLVIALFLMGFAVGALVVLFSLIN
jgi:hypothetical protein